MRTVFDPLSDTYGLEAMHGSKHVYRQRCCKPFKYSPGHALLEYDAIARGTTPASVAVLLEEISEMMRIESMQFRGKADFSTLVARYRYLQDALVGAIGLHDLTWAYNLTVRMATLPASRRRIPVAGLTRHLRSFAPHNTARILGWIVARPVAGDYVEFDVAGNGFDGSDGYFDDHTRRRQPREGMPLLGRASLEHIVLQEAVA